MGGLDSSFDAVIYIGYHSPEGMNTNPLAHTTEHEWFNWIKINDRLASEFSMNVLYAANLGIPSVFLSGDRGICDHARDYCSDIVTVAVKEGVGNSSWNMHPEDSIRAIKSGVKEALRDVRPVCLERQEYKMDIFFKEHQRARAASWYPKAELTGSNSVRYTAEDVDELMAAFPTTRLHYVAADGCALLLRGELDAMEESTFQLYLRYHFATCERADLLGVTSHALDIFRK